MEKKQEEMNVFDFNNTIAEFISGGLRKYIEENKNATFPTAPSSKFLGCEENASLEERMSEWHKVLERLAIKFDDLSTACHFEQEDIDGVFDELKRIYNHLWI